MVSWMAPSAGMIPRTLPPRTTPATSSPRTAGWPTRSASSPSALAATSIAMNTRKKCSIRTPPSAGAEAMRNGRSTTRGTSRKLQRFMAKSLE